MKLSLTYCKCYFIICVGFGGFTIFRIDNQLGFVFVSSNFYISKRLFLTKQTAINFLFETKPDAFKHLAY